MNNESPKPIDLHVHSTKSDGTLTPTQLVALAQQKGLGAFALTDHDSVNGIAEAMKAAEGTGIEVVPGIEYSTKYLDKDVHIVGLYYDWQNPDFQKEVQVFTKERDRRNEKMCERMAADGIPITYDAVKAENPGAVITRANIAAYLFRHGVTHSVPEAFETLIGDDCPYFIPRDHITPERAISFTLQYGGIPILAHPFQYELGDEGLETLVQRLRAAGLLGIEAYYCKHTPEMTEQIRTLARKYNLLLSGGSDFHGANKPQLEMGTGYGHLRVPGELLIRMKHCLHHVTDHTKIFFCDFDGTLGTSGKIISPRTKQSLDAFVARGKEMVTPIHDAGTAEDSLTAKKGSTEKASLAKKIKVTSAVTATSERKESIAPGVAQLSAADPDFTRAESADGNIFVLSSGRAMSDVKNLLHRLRLTYPHMYLSGYNGAEIYDVEAGRTFMRKTLSIPTVRRVMELAKEYGIYCQSYDGDDIVAESAEDANVPPARDLTAQEKAEYANGYVPLPLSPENPSTDGMTNPPVSLDIAVRPGATESASEYRNPKTLMAADTPSAGTAAPTHAITYTNPDKVEEKSDILARPDCQSRTPRHMQKETAYYTTYVKMPVRLEKDVAGSLSEEPCKCLAIHLTNPEDHLIERFQERLREEFGDNLILLMSNPYYLEIDAKDATKGYSLTWLCRYLGIDRANAIAAGDAPNDLPMLRAAGVGIGMCNGIADNPGITEAADIMTTEDNDHDGLAPILDTL